MLCNLALNYVQFITHKTISFVFRSDIPFTDRVCTRCRSQCSEVGLPWYWRSLSIVSDVAQTSGRSSRWQVSLIKTINDVTGNKKLENDTRLELIFTWYFYFCLREKWKIDGPYDDPDGWLNKSHGLKENSLQYAVQKVFVVKRQDNSLCFVNFCTK